MVLDVSSVPAADVVFSAVDVPGVPAAARVSAVAAVSMDVDVPSALLVFPTFLNP
jgi:hypothetical protein